MAAIDRYEILELLGTGGMGKVYKARDTVMDRIVALKVLQDNCIAEDSRRTRFDREGVLLSSLRHEHIVLFYAFGLRPDGAPQISMEYLEGESLRALLNRVSKLDWKRALKIGIQVCEALDYAHKNGIVHRDLKPENIMLLHGTEPDFVKVLDFGLATIMPGSASDLQKLTATGKLLGSLRYMSPELFRGAKPDHRSDIYALACFIYESILGETPFKADSDFELIFQHANTSPKFFPTSGKTDLPPGIAGVLAKALQKEPSERYQNMADFKSDLQYLLDGKTEKLTVKEMQKSSWKSLFAPVLICFLTVFAIAFAVESVQNNTKHAQGVKAEKTPDLKTLPQARFFIRKGFQGNILPLELIDKGLALEGLNNADRAEFLVLKARQAKAYPQIYYCLALDALSKCKPGSYPGSIILESLEKVLSFTWNADLLAQTQKFAAEYEKQFAKIKPVNREERNNFRFRLLLTKARMARLLLRCAKTEAALGLLENVLLKGAPLVDTSELMIDLGQTAQVLAHVEKFPEEVELAIGSSNYFRRKGMIEQASECTRVASKSAKEFRSEYKKLLVLESEVLIATEKGEKTRAIELIDEYIRNKEKIGYADKGSMHYIMRFLVSISGLCAKPEQAITTLQRLKQNASKDRQNDEILILNRLERIKNSAPADHKSRFEFLVQQARIFSGDFDLERLFFVADAYSMLMDSHNKEFPENLRCECLELYRQCLCLLILPKQELSLCDQLMAEPGASTNFISIDSDDSGLSYFQVAQLRRVELLVDTLRKQEARAALDRLEKTELTDMQRAKILLIELTLNDSKRAELHAEACHDANALRLMSRHFRRYFRLDLAKKCVSRAIKLPVDQSLKVLLNIEAAFVELEMDNRTEANKILDETDFRKLKQSQTEFADQNLLDLANAMALLYRSKDVDNLIEFREKLRAI